MQTKFRPIALRDTEDLGAKEDGSREAQQSQLVKPVPICVNPPPTSLPRPIAKFGKGATHTVLKPIPASKRILISFDDEGLRERKEHSETPVSRFEKAPLGNGDETSSEAPLSEQVLLNGEDSVTTADFASEPIWKADGYHANIKVHRDRVPTASSYTTTDSTSNSQSASSIQVRRSSESNSDRERNASSQSLSDIEQSGLLSRDDSRSNPDVEVYSAGSTNQKGCPRESLLKQPSPYETNDVLNIDSSSQSATYPSQTGEHAPPNNSITSGDASVTRVTDGSAIKTSSQDSASNNSPLDVVKQSMDLPSSADSNGSIKQLESTSSSASSSPPEGEDRFQEFNKPKIRKTSSGHRLSLRRFDRKRSGSSSDSDSSNPWFQQRSKPDEDEDDMAFSEAEEAPVAPEPRSRRKKFGKLSRLFRTQSRNPESDYMQEPSSSSSAESLSLNGSLSGSSSVPLQGGGSTTDVLEDQLEHTIRRAISGRQRLEDVMDSLLTLTGRPSESVLKLLFKYLGSSSAIDTALKLIFEYDLAVRAEIPLTSSAPYCNRPTRYGDALVQLFINGSSRLKRSLLAHGKARSELLRFFTDERPVGELETNMWIAKATRVAKILNCILADCPTEFTEYISSKKGFLRLMVKNHIHVPEVVEFMAQLCAADALSTTTGEELRFGAANATGIILLAKEGVCDILVEVFVTSCNNLARGKEEKLSWQVQVMSMRCLYELSKRAVVVPKFGKGNCSYSSRHIKTLNSSLDSLNLFLQTNRVKSILESGFEAISEGLGFASFGTHSERNNPLACGLSVMTNLLEAVRSAKESKLVVTRRTVGSTNTEGMERVLISNMDRLCKLLQRKYETDVSGRVRLEIVRLLESLCTSALEDTWVALVRNAVPDKLLRLLSNYENCSLLHTGVVKCISASLLKCRGTLMHKAWLQALGQQGGWLSTMREYFQAPTPAAESGPLRYCHAYLEIGFVVVDFSEDGKERRLAPMLENNMELAAYVGCVEAGLKRLREEYSNPCGGPKPEGQTVSVLANVESLTARLNDVNAV